LTLQWVEPQRIERVELIFDTDRDNPLYSVLYGNPERIMPQCVRHFLVFADRRRLLHECRENHQSRVPVALADVRTDTLQIELSHPSERVPAALFEVRCYGNRT
jgi:hypothetical protein